MSGIKRYMEQLEHQLEIGRQIAIEAGVLQLCEYHEVAFNNNGEVQGAYMLGNAKFTRGDLKGVFADRREMTDAYKESGRR